MGYLKVICVSQHKLGVFYYMGSFVILDHASINSLLNFALFVLSKIVSSSVS